MTKCCHYSHKTEKMILFGREENTEDREDWGGGWTERRRGKKDEKERRRVGQKLQDQDIGLAWMCDFFFFFNVRQVLPSDRYGSYRWALEDATESTFEKHCRLYSVSFVKLNSAWKFQKTLLLGLTKLCTRGSNVSQKRENRKRYFHLCLKIKRFVYPKDSEW